MIAPPRTRVTVANMTSKSVPERYVEYLSSLAPYMDDPAAALIFATMTTVLRPVEVLDDAARLQGGDIVVDESPMATLAASRFVAIIAIVFLVSNASSLLRQTKEIVP